MSIQVIMPQLGESVVEGKVSRWLKKEGDSVARLEPLLEVETDKVTTEVTAEQGGLLLKILVAEGTTVKAGTPLAIVGQAGEAVAPAPGAHGAPASAHGAPAPAPVRAPDGAPAPAAPERGTRGKAFVSPVVARIAAEQNVDVALVAGTGQGGRVTKQDILAYIAARGKAPAAVAATPSPMSTLAPWETPGSGDLFGPTDEIYKRMQGGGASAAAAPAAVPAPVAAPEAAPAPVAAASVQVPGDQVVPHSTMRRAIAEHMVRSERTSPHVTTVFEVDMHVVTQHIAANRAQFERDGVRLTYTPYFVAATVAALKALPIVNSSWSDEGVVLHRTINIGMAVSLGADGLIVPVIKGADGMNLLGLARVVNDLAARARAKQLRPDDVQGGTFTITNHGVSGSLFATPIINQPQIGILGTGIIEKRVKVIGDAIAIRPMCYVSLTFDHRVLDGASGDGFVAHIKKTLEHWA